MPGRLIFKEDTEIGWSVESCIQFMRDSEDGWQVVDLYSFSHSVMQCNSDHTMIVMSLQDGLLERLRYKILLMTFQNLIVSELHVATRINYSAWWILIDWYEDHAIEKVIHHSALCSITWLRYYECIKWSTSARWSISMIQADELHYMTRIGLARTGEQIIRPLPSGARNYSRGHDPIILPFGITCTPTQTWNVRTLMHRTRCPPWQWWHGLRFKILRLETVS